MPRSKSLMFEALVSTSAAICGGVKPREAALGQEAATVLPEALRLVELRARVPRYQRDMLRYLAMQYGTTVEEVLTRELEDVACAHAAELSAAVAGFDVALTWP